LATISYGERIPSAEGFDYAPLVERAGALVARHYGHQARILRREWFCATGPDVVVVHLFIRHG